MIAGVSLAGGAGLVFRVTAGPLLATAWLSRWAPDNDNGLESIDLPSAPHTSN